MRGSVSRSIRSLLIALALLAMPAAALAQVSVSITVAPPELPVYDQPACPGDGYIWTPGYWAWGDAELLLGAGDLGDGSRSRLPLDSGLLGLGRQRLCFLRRLLGAASRFLRRN